MPELGPEARDLLALDVEHGGPTDAQSARVRRAVLSEVTAGAAAVAAAGLAQKTTTVVAAGGKAAGASGLLLKLAVTLVLGIAIGTSATTAYFRSSMPATSVAPFALPGLGPAASSVSARADAPVPSVTAARMAPFASVPPLAPADPVGPSLARGEMAIPRRELSRPLPAPSSVTTSPPPTPRVATSSDTTAPELALLHDARVALRDGDPLRALSALDAHARRFSSGTLSEERDALRIEALCALHRSGEAAADQAGFARAYPTSPLGPAVSRSCPSP